MKRRCMPERVHKIEITRIPDRTDQEAIMQTAYLRRTRPTLPHLLFLCTAVILVGVDQASAQPAASGFNRNAGTSVTYVVVNQP